MDAAPQDRPVTGNTAPPARLIATATNGRVTILDRDALPLVTAALEAAG